jgi:ferredoxin
MLHWHHLFYIHNPKQHGRYSMKTILYYFSGTGNSLAIAKSLCTAIGECDIIPVATATTNPGPIVPGVERVGIVNPVYFTGIPSLVAEFAGRLDLTGVRYLFAVETMGGSGGPSALHQLDTILKRSMGNRGLDAGFSVKMPGNYLLMYNPPEGQKRDGMLEDSDRYVQEIAGVVKGEKRMKIPSSLLLSLIHRVMYPRFLGSVHESDRKFSVDERCTSCGTCVEVCPVRNIRLEGGRPTWLHRCEQCLACIQLCPAEAIQAGGKTDGRERYRHPAISIAELKGQSGRPPAG